MSTFTSTTIVTMKRVIAFFDQETNVWVAQSDDIIGLVTEGATFDILLQRIKACAADLMLSNAGQIADSSGEYEVVVADHLMSV